MVVPPYMVASMIVVVELMVDFGCNSVGKTRYSMLLHYTVT